MDFARLVKRSFTVADKPQNPTFVHLGWWGTESNKVGPACKTPPDDGGRRVDQSRQVVQQGCVKPLVCVDAQAPRLRALVQRELLLSGVTRPVFVDGADGPASTHV